MKTNFYTELLAQLRLFKGIVWEQSKDNIFSSKGLQYGLLIPDNFPSYIIDNCIELYGKDGEKWNQTLHKSFKTVKDASIGELIAEQLIHYFTTYGLERLNLYNEELVYIPKEDLNIPELEEDIPLVCIKIYTETELKDKLNTLVKSDIALSEQTIEDILVISDYIDKNEIDDITNREVKIALYRKYRLTPSNNVEFLRFVIAELTGKTLLIKNNELIKSIKQGDIKVVIGYIKNYVNYNDGYRKLAQIFYRYKNLFLAMKRDCKFDLYGSDINYIINKIRRLAIKYHKPLKANVLDQLTQITDINKINQIEIETQLDAISIFREIRITNALRYRLNKKENIYLYRIRNGKAFVKSQELDDITDSNQQKVIFALHAIIYKHLCNRLNKSLQNKIIYLPEEIVYMAPSSEKQFVGNIPEGSYIQIPKEQDIVIGIHWENIKGNRIDLDLHASNPTENYGWNNSWRNEDEDFFFSGDLTTAPEGIGASELFYIAKGCKSRSFILNVNDFTACNFNIPFEVVIAKADKKDFESDYVINPNNIITTIPMIIANKEDNITRNQVNIGLVDIQEDKIKFSLNNFSVSNSIISQRDNLANMVHQYCEVYLQSQLTLKQLLKDAHIEINKEKQIEKLIPIEITDKEGNTRQLYDKQLIPVDYDLSLENINKETIIKMFT